MFFVFRLKRYNSQYILSHFIMTFNKYQVYLPTCIYCMSISYLKLLSFLVYHQDMMISQLPNCFSHSSQRCEQFFFFAFFFFFFFWQLRKMPTLFLSLISQGPVRCCFRKRVTPPPPPKHFCDSEGCPVKLPDN